MKNNIKLSVLFFTVWALFASSLSAEEPKVASVSIRVLLTEYYRFPIEKKRLNEEMERIKAEDQAYRESLEEMGKQLAEMKKKIESATTSKKEKDEQTQKYQALLKKGQQSNVERVDTYKRRLRAMKIQQKDLIDSMGMSIMKIVAKYSEDKGYDLVFDKDGATKNGTPSIIYSKAVADITDDIMKVLNDGNPAKKASE